MKDEADGAGRAFEPIAQDYVDLVQRRARRARRVKAGSSAAALLLAVSVGSVLAVDTSRPGPLPTRGQVAASAKRWIEEVLADAHYAGGYRMMRDDLACVSDSSAHGELETDVTLTSLDSVQGSTLVLIADVDWWGRGFSQAPGTTPSDTSVVSVRYASYMLTLTAGANDTSVRIAVGSCYAGSGPAIPTSTSTTIATPPGPGQPGSGL